VGYIFGNGEYSSIYLFLNCFFTFISPVCSDPAPTSSISNLNKCKIRKGKIPENLILFNRLLNIITFKKILAFEDEISFEIKKLKSRQPA
jgi:hypothetical protein